MAREIFKAYGEEDQSHTAFTIDTQLLDTAKEFKSVLEDSGETIVPLRTVREAVDFLAASAAITEIGIAFDDQSSGIQLIAEEQTLAAKFNK